MDQQHSSTTSSPAPQLLDDHDEWDNEGFIVPSFGIESTDESNFEVQKSEDSKTSPVEDTQKDIYLGPHGAAPQPKQQETNPSTSRKQHFKQKLKDADKRTNNSGRENRVETLRELIGGSSNNNASGNISEGSAKEWLDPHCDESLFERRNS